MDCYSNQLTSLDVSGCSVLRELYCYSNQLTSLDVPKNKKNLEMLHCYSNQLTSLDVSGCTALTYLHCYSNQLTSVNVSGCTKLKILECYFNQLTSVNVSGCTALSSLYCYSNQLTSLDVSENIALYTLECHGNQLTSLDVSKNTKLTFLVCYSNQIKGAAMDALVANLPAIKSGKGAMLVKFFENEYNVMTIAQVTGAKAKDWTPYYTDGEVGDEYVYLGYVWKPYAGVDPSTEVNNVETSEAEDSAPWYTINGVQLTGKPTIPGIYIHGGKKVIVK